jgi:hypothetical protein
MDDQGTYFFEARYSSTSSSVMHNAPNKSMDTNRRQPSPLDAAGKVGHAVYAPTRVTAAVGHLSCYVC